ncbi:hypothetical protein JZU54_01120, partial [bacterium]|nr:hypothetical protein [bacterium]
ASPGVNAQLARLAAAPQRSSPRITLREESHRHGFTQVNEGAAELLAHLVTEMAGAGELLVDAYCGAGFFSKKLAPRFNKII